MFSGIRSKIQVLKEVDRLLAQTFNHVAQNIDTKALSTMVVKNAYTMSPDVFKSSLNKEAIIKALALASIAQTIEMLSASYNQTKIIEDTLYDALYNGSDTYMSLICDRQSNQSISFLLASYAQSIAHQRNIGLGETRISEIRETFGNDTVTLFYNYAPINVIWQTSKLSGEDFEEMQQELKREAEEKTAYHCAAEYLAA